MNPTALDFFRARIGQALAEHSPSPLGRWLGGRLVEVEEGSLTVEYGVREEFCNPALILHGGVVAAIMDDLMGTTVFSLGLPTFYTSVNLSIDFLWSAPLGSTITAKSRIVRQGRKIINATCEIRDAEGILVAQCSSNLVATSKTL